MKRLKSVVVKDMSAVWNTSLLYLITTSTVDTPAPGVEHLSLAYFICQLSLTTQTCPIIFLSPLSFSVFNNTETPVAESGIAFCFS